MGLIQTLSVLALRQFAQVLTQSEALAAAVDCLVERFTDHSQRLNKALQSANDLAWRSLEIALEGESLWTSLDRTEDKAFRQQVRTFLDAVPLLELAGKTQFRKQCARDIRKARKAGLLSSGALDPRELAGGLGMFARFHDPQSILNAEWQALEGMGQCLRQEGYRSLGDLFQIRPAKGAPLLVIAVRYFFQRAVEGDEQLFRGLAFARLESLQQNQEQAFRALHQALTEQGARLEALLGEVQAVVVDTHAAVLDVRAEQERHGEQNRDLYQEVLRLKEKLDLMHHEVRPRDSLSIRSEEERRLVKQLVDRYRALPEERRRNMPALLNAFGQLAVAAGEFGQAERHFKEATELVADPQARGEVYLNAYRAALEQQQQDVALQELLKAVKLDGKRFAPFPVGKYHPRRILGAGGFGVAFLCRHKELDADVVVKTLHGDVLARSVDDVLAEARLLYRLDHPCIIRLLDCGYTVPSSKSRPYFVMSYFPGATLEDRVRHGVLAVDDAMAVARLMAEGLEAAHAKGVRHRDVKPANVLVRKDDGGWRLKLIDFGLALRTETVRRTMQAATARRHSVSGDSFAGTIEYAAPEQMGRLPGVAVGTYSDLYSWAKTCCYALFRTTHPLPKHWKAIPDPFAGVLEQCLEENPRERPASCAEVVRRLNLPVGPTNAPIVAGSRSASVPAWVSERLEGTQQQSPGSEYQVEMPEVVDAELVEGVEVVAVQRGRDAGKQPSAPGVHEQAGREVTTDPSKVVRPSNPPKEPLLMALLSFLIVGLGQMLLGQVAKGAVILVSAIVLGGATAGFAIPFIWLFSALDAYAIAKKLKDGKAVGLWEFF